MRRNVLNIQLCARRGVYRSALTPLEGSHIPRHVCGQAPTRLWNEKWPFRRQGMCGRPFFFLRTLTLLCLSWGCERRGRAFLCTFTIPYEVRRCVGAVLTLFLLYCTVDRRLLTGSILLLCIILFSLHSRVVSRPDWEARDVGGRLVYINHATRVSGLA